MHHTIVIHKDSNLAKRNKSLRTTKIQNYGKNQKTTDIDWPTQGDGSRRNSRDLGEKDWVQTCKSKGNNLPTEERGIPV